MNPDEFRKHRTRVSVCTGLRRMPRHLPVYLGHTIEVLDTHQRCKYNFAVIIGGRYCEFANVRQAKSAIRQGLLRGAA